MYRLTFTVEWGSWTGYFSPEYLPSYDFGGRLEAENGEILGVERIIFPHDDWGPFVYSKRFEPYGRTEWESVTHNSFDGLRVTVMAEDRTVLRIRTHSGEAAFTPPQLRRVGHLVWHAGEKYSMALIHVEPEDPAWRLALPQQGETRLPGTDFSGRQADFFGVRGVLLPPGGETGAAFDAALPELSPGRWDVRMQIRFLISQSDGAEVPARGLPLFMVTLNGREVYRNRKFATFHDTASQFLEEDEVTLPDGLLRPWDNRIQMVSRDERLSVLVQMVRFLPRERRPLRLTSCPRWVVAGEPFCVAVRCTLPSARLHFTFDPAVFSPAMPAGEIGLRHRMSRGVPNLIPDDIPYIWEGEHEFFFVAKRAFADGVIEIADAWSGASVRAVIAQGWAFPAGTDRMETGVEIKTGSPWEYGQIIRRMRDEQLGNLAVFRDYHNRFTHAEKLWEAAADCRKYGFSTDAVGMKDQSVVAAASAGNCRRVGGHEATGIFYGSHPPQNECRSLREAQTYSLAVLRGEADAYRIPGVPVAMGDASGGSRYAYMAGFDVLRHETFVGHHSLILPNARGCARAFGKKGWGVHIASQHNAQPELDDGLRRLWLGFYLAWVCGASFAYEEDSLFLCFKYYRMVSQDYLPRHKAAICREFHRYTRTHPRRGRPRVNIAVLQGRYAPPFSGISTTNDPAGAGSPAFRNENFPVWGMAGREAWEWGFRQPEKGFHLLETLAPGIYLPPLMQQETRVRKFFSGNPWGEFDFVPVEGGARAFAEYPVMLLLGWHTMETYAPEPDDGCRNDYERLLRYVRGGGTLFLAVPHLTTRADRDFLRDMGDLRLIYGGDAVELCGVRIAGPAEAVFSEAVGAGDFARVRFDHPRELLRRPNASPEEDGPCRLADVTLAGAEPVMCDRVTGRPLVVRQRLGKGTVYLLCAWAYPGHEALRDVMPALLEEILRRHVRRPVTVDDPSGEVYWSRWEDGAGTDKLYLLNTDWTAAGNIRRVTVHAGGTACPMEAREGAVREIIRCGDALLWVEEGEAGLTLAEHTRSVARYSLMGFGRATLCAACAGGARLEIEGLPPMTLSAVPCRIEVDFSRPDRSCLMAVIRTER